MADSTLSLSNFLSLESSAPEEDEDDENVMPLVIDDEEFLRVLLDKEMMNLNRIDQSNVPDWIQTARSESIKWIFNMRSSLRFRYHTAYLSVTFIDRFISKSHITVNKPWVIRLLSIACLSLAIKTIDRTKLELSSLLQTEGFNFQINSIHKMELLVLSTLDWKMYSITPFYFIDYFVKCLFEESSLTKRVVLLISQIICATTNDVKLMEHRSSSIAMAATLMVMDQGLTKESMEMKVKKTWVNQLFDHADVYACYSRMMELEPLKLNIFQSDLANKEENPSKRQKNS